MPWSAPFFCSTGRAPTRPSAHHWNWYLSSSASVAASLGVVGSPMMRTSGSSTCHCVGELTVGSAWRRGGGSLASLQPHAFGLPLCDRFGGGGLLYPAAAGHEFQPGAVGVLQAVLDEGNGELRHVNADPVAAEFLGGVNGRAAAAERVQHHVAGIAAGLDDPLQQRHRLLRRVAETFLGLRS